MRRSQILALLAFSISAPVATWAFVRLVAPGLSSPAAPQPSYSELIATLLTGVTVSLALLAMVIAVLAVWGYRAIRDEAKDLAKSSATSEAHAQVEAYLKSEHVTALM